ncbi:MAG: tRNA1(Val) (adenine(37)-N6)-methyltransferase [Eubacteriaceae bacterium]|nr:tRNA1(Val) (adenine(37)-N6)-methyltransferase [Eubacteriaceae bacterium]
MDNGNIRIDDLQRGGLVICQDPSSFCFGVDAVLLADFAASRINWNERTIDLCSGNGIIPLLLTARLDGLDITSIEIDEAACDLAKRSISINKLENIKVICQDIRKLPPSFTGFDALTANPPYIPLGGGLPSQKAGFERAKHEVSLTLAELITTASRLLKNKGRFFLVHRSHRVGEIFNEMQRSSLAPKQAVFVYPKPGSKSNLVLVYGIKNGGEWCDILPPLYIYNEDGNYTKEVLSIYGQDV